MITWQKGFSLFFSGQGKRGLLFGGRMKERPILFSGQMVRAILEGRKTQTRRVIKNQPHEDCGTIEVGHYHPTVTDRHGDEQPGDEIFGAYSLDGEWGAKCPYGEPGDRLWVRETWGIGTRPDPYDGWRDGVEYRADEGDLQDERELLPLYPVEPPEGRSLDEWQKCGWRPSIHMPRWASRLTLEVTGVRVERLQDIGEADAVAEGCIHHNDPSGDGQNVVEQFAYLWESINGIGSWDANPWVWVVDFRVVR